jgi:hypothetical protein
MRFPQQCGCIFYFLWDVTIFHVARSFWRLESIAVLFERRELPEKRQAPYPTRLQSSNINKYKRMSVPKNDILKASGNLDANDYMVSAMILLVAAPSNRQFVKRSPDMSHSLHLWWSFRPTSLKLTVTDFTAASIYKNTNNSKHVQHTVTVCSQMVVKIQFPVLSPKVSQSLLTFEIGSNVSVCCHVCNDDLKQPGTSQ